MVRVKNYEIISTFVKFIPIEYYSLFSWSRCTWTKKYKHCIFIYRSSVTWAV